jgi:hypothetical protein
VRPGVEQAGGKQQGNEDWVHKSDLWAEWRPWGKSIRVALQRVMVPAH